MKPPLPPDCPAPLGDHDRVLMAHGGGGRLTQQLIERLFLQAFANPHLKARHDAAVMPFAGQRLAFSTDAHVVKPLFFPGGDIGSLAVNGTVNDLAMAGARARWLSASFIIEEGLGITELERVVASMQKAATEAEVQIVAGDTKVVDRGKGDGLFISTAGVGTLPHALAIAPARVQPGDVILVSGDLGRHGMAIMSVREGLEFESPIESDCAPLVAPVMALLDAGVEVHCLRDLTRGGLASALNEIAAAAGVSMEINDNAVPVTEPVRGACEILGLDPLYVANEGRFIAIISSRDLPLALETLHREPVSAGAVLIGNVVRGHGGQVTLQSRLGVPRVLDLLSGEQLPRIC